MSVATYGEHAENAAQALNVLIRADEIPTDPGAVDQMLHCREAVVDALRQRLYDLGQDDWYPPADHLPARTPKPMLAGLDEKLASLVDNITFALPSLPFDERRPPSEVLGVESADPTVETWRAAGIELLAGSHTLVLNCDAWNNWDSVSEGGRGGNTDGFGCHVKKGDVGNVFRGCRAWYNSDDGYDCINCHEAVIFENCWAMYNGLNGQGRSLGDGNGFKAGGYGATPAARLPAPIPRNTVRFCLAVGNKASGFYANHHPGGSDWISNTAFRNPTNYNMLERLADNTTDVPGIGHKMRNNLGYKGGRELNNLAPQDNDLAANSFTLDLAFTDADFVSVDEKQLVAPRAADGGLPPITFMHLADKSKAIDAGVDAGFPFKGAKPDLGAFEK